MSDLKPIREALECAAQLICECDEISDGESCVKCRSADAIAHLDAIEQGTTDRVFDVEVAARALDPKAWKDDHHSFSAERREQSISDASICAKAWGLKWK